MGSDDDPRTGSGRGGGMGTPGPLPQEAPPSADQERKAVISGGGVVDPDHPDDSEDASSGGT